jgi:hypothetical protein
MFPWLSPLSQRLKSELMALPRSSEKIRASKRASAIDESWLRPGRGNLVFQRSLIAASVLPGKCLAI